MLIGCKEVKKQEDEQMGRKKKNASVDLEPRRNRKKETVSVNFKEPL